MAKAEKAASPRTPDGDIDWETVFEAPETGLIPRILRSRTPESLRKNTIAVLSKLYADGTAPAFVTGFSAKLDETIPDDLDEENVVKASDAITMVMRRIKDERIAQIKDATQTEELAPDTADKDGSPPTPAPKADKPARAVKSSGINVRFRMMALAGVAGVIVLAAGLGGWWWLTGAGGADAASSQSQQLIEEMRAAARGEGPERHVFGWALQTKIKDGLIGITAVGVPADACASAAWVFVNRGNIIINDFMPKKISPQTLRQACALKGQRASLTWIQRLEEVEKNQ
jgi:hypothetical protein